MCELFAVNSEEPVYVNEYLKELYSHSVKHPDGWGLAYLDDDNVNIEKEPLRALDSAYLKRRLEQKIEAKKLFAHIRQASHGGLKYDNCHPFLERDMSGRKWTLMHNGMILNFPEMEKYNAVQKGETDSERILFYLLDQINEETKKKGRELNADERFKVMDDLILAITPNNNKVNLIVWDGEQLYIHTNLKDTLHLKKTAGSVIVSTRALEETGWENVPFMQLLAYQNGELVREGTRHSNEFFYDDEIMKKFIPGWPNV